MKSETVSKRDSLDTHRHDKCGRGIMEVHHQVDLDDKLWRDAEKTV